MMQAITLDEIEAAARIVYAEMQRRLLNIAGRCFVNV